MGTYEPCVLGSDGNCTRWSHDHAADRPSATDQALAEVVGKVMSPLPDDARMDAYYYGFERTGVGAVDAILSAVAVAGKGLHSTEGWADDQPDYWGLERPGLPSGQASAEALIQATADQSAVAIRGALAAGRAESSDHAATTEDAADHLITHQPTYSNTHLRYICRCGDESHWPTHAAKALADAGLLATARTLPTREDLARAIAAVVHHAGYEPDHPTPNRHDYRAADAVLALLRGDDE